MKVFPLLMVALLAVGSTSIAAAQGGLGKGGGGGSGGGGKSSPPVRNNGGGGSGGGGGQSSPPVRNNGGGSGGGKSSPPVRSGGGSGSPPVRNNGGGQSSPPVRSGGGSGGGLGRGGSGGGDSRGGGSLPPTRDRDNGGRDTGGVIIGGGARNGGPVITGRGDTSPSKSGRVNYGNSTTNRNQGNGRNNNYSIPAPPVINSTISREANREGGRIQRNYDGYRSGYYHYDRGWRDNNFWYPHYSFSYSNHCYPSPFYYYPHLPGYISSVRVDLDFISISWTQGTYYNWRYSNDDWGYSSNRRGYDRDLDRATDDIYDSFRRGDMRFLENLIPYRGWVNVEVDRYVQYRIGGDDFYDMMRDLVEGTYTTDYRIRRVRTWRGGASIEAEHEYRTPFGKTERVRHYYGLRDTGRGYEITNFRFDN